MYFINPFKGLRPSEEKASSVSIPSTDHLSQEIITKHKKDNPWSYLNIFSNKIHSKAKEQFELMKNNSIIKKDGTNSFYIYKISTENHSQVGVMVQQNCPPMIIYIFVDMKKFILKDLRKDLIK